MASEPILCFDGDSAGRKAAFRAIETALPLIGAGKSLRFALLPEGQDPDDLVRAERGGGDGGGPQRRPSVCRHAVRRARPRTSGFDTPEQRAGLERRLREAVAAIADETLRKHYQADMERRLAALFGEERPDAGRRVGGTRRAPFGQRRGGPLPLARPRVGLAERAAAAAGQARAARRECRRARSSILAIALGHPALLESALRGARGDRFRERRPWPRSATRCSPLPPEALGAPEALAEALDAAGRGRNASASWPRPPRCRTGGACAPRPQPSDAEQCCGKAWPCNGGPGALHRELKLAERSLAAEPNEQNLARLLDIKANLADLADAEAAIDGFGDLSGRARRRLSGGATRRRA